MGRKTFFLLLGITYVFFNCSDDKLTLKECELQELGVTKSDTIFDFRNNGVLFERWRGTYSQDKVFLKFITGAGFHEEEEFIFEFNKINNCLELFDAYSIYTGSYHATIVYKLEIDSLTIQDWSYDELLSGEIKFKKVFKDGSFGLI